MTFLSRGLGFVRDMLLAILFGASAGFDAFLVAFKIPNFMRGLFAEGSFAQAFVPVLSQYQTAHTKEETQQFIATTVGRIGVILLLFTLACEILTPLIVLFFAPGFLDDGYRYHTAVSMLRITFPYVFLVSMAALWAAVLNSNGHFWAPSFTPVILNLILIISAFYFPAFFAVPEKALAWGIFTAGLIQVLFQIPFLARYKLLMLPRWTVKEDSSIHVLKGFLPALFGVSVLQIGLLLDTLFASFLQIGSISWLYYADRLAFFPLGIFGVALVTVLLPHLSSLHARSKWSEFSTTLDWALRLILLISLPAMLGLVMLSGPLTVTLFKHGQFNMNDLEMTRIALLAFSLGLPAFMLVKVLACAFYSRQDVRKPVRIALYSTLLNLVVNLLLVVPLTHVGLALGTSCSAMLNAWLLYKGLVKRGMFQPLAGWSKFLGQILFANMMMVSLLYYGPPTMKIWLGWQWHIQVGHLVFWIVSAITLYFICLWISGMRFQEWIQTASSITPTKAI